MYDCCEQQRQEVLFKIEFKPEASTIVPKRTTCKQTEYDCKLGLTVCSDVHATRLHDEAKQRPPSQSVGWKLSKAWCENEPYSRQMPYLHWTKQLFSIPRKFRVRYPQCTDMGLRVLREIVWATGLPTNQYRENPTSLVSGEKPVPRRNQNHAEYNTKPVKPALPNH